MRMIRITPWTTGPAAILCLLNTVALETAVVGADFVCGPRCVHYLIGKYCPNDRTELIDVIREMQWPHLEEGTNLADLASGLQRRGIHSCAIKLGPTDELAWPHPVIVHLNPDASGELGHFVVWLPPSQPGRTEVWSGVHGIQSGRWSNFRQRMSGNVLLTSSDVISDSSLAIRRNGGVLWYAIAALLVGCVVGASQWLLRIVGRSYRYKSL